MFLTVHYAARDFDLQTDRKTGWRVKSDIGNVNFWLFRIFISS